MSEVDTQKLVDLRCSGKVERSHVVPHHGSYSNAAHQWGVAVLFMQLFPELWDEDVAAYCLTHDVPELWVGDTPQQAKRALNLGNIVDPAEHRVMEFFEFPTPEWFTPDQLAAFRDCDLLEFYLWCREEELMLGNQYAGQHARRVEVKVQSREIMFSKPEVGRVFWNLSERGNMMPRLEELLRVAGEQGET